MKQAAEEARVCSDRGEPVSNGPNRRLKLQSQALVPKAEAGVRSAGSMAEDRTVPERIHRYRLLQRLFEASRLFRLNIVCSSVERRPQVVAGAYCHRAATLYKSWNFDRMLPAGCSCTSAAASRVYYIKLG